MNIGRHIRKIIIVCFWVTAGAGTLLLLIAAIKTRGHKTCTGYEVKIKSFVDQPFLEEKDIVALLTKQGRDPIEGKKLQSFSLASMETKLEKSPWIRDAELFFDNNEILQVLVTERTPVARVFTVNGNSFYVDDACKKLPLTEKLTVRLPVFTNFPNEKMNTRSRAALLCSIKNLSLYILKDPFWMAQTAQVDIVGENGFELYPTLGNHKIVFGDASNAEKKFRHLLIFYKQVLSKTGLDKYSIINAQYASQIIGTKRGSVISKTDSVQAMKNIEQLIKQAQTMLADTVNMAGVQAIDTMVNR